MGVGTRNLLVLFIWCFFLCLTPSSSMRTILREGETLKTSDQLFSEHGKFVLRFFDPNYLSENLVISLGLFYNAKPSSSRDPVWVADRNAIDHDGAANLTLGNDGSLKILYDGGRSFVLYSSPAPTNSSVVLRDDGNLVLRGFNPGESSQRELWQSFDHPTDTLLPGMKLGFDKKTGKNLSLVSNWNRSGNGLGSYALGVDASKMNQLVIWWLGEIMWTSGSWANENFTLSGSENDKFDYVSNENETYFTFSPFGDIFDPRLKLEFYGAFHLLTSDPSGATNFYVNCHSNIYDEDYRTDYRTMGCVENFQKCNETADYFYGDEQGIMSGRGTKMSKNWSMTDCLYKCYDNCSCVACAYFDDGCEFWSHGSTFRDADGGEIIFRKLKYQGMQIKNLDGPKKKVVGTILAFAVGGAAFLIMIIWSCYRVARRWRRKAETKRKQKELLQEISGESLPPSTKKKTKKQKTQRELQIFSFKTLVLATKNFSHENLLGKGGYGPVYKGRLADGQEIAIKRLSTSSGQGLEEFKKEAMLIAKLQHTNLVRLLGICVQGDEKALVYEFMPNKSLDFFLFDSDRKKILDWKTRFIVIQGIAQGLVYLHKYSRLKVIHRDLKASNVLLDLEMNPKISDFGMARLLAPGDLEENTNRIVGTFGYMPPEYALQGTVSTKTDVFSFGILLLEIVSGRKNNSRYHPDHPLNLTGYAWTLWKEGNCVELIDPSLGEAVPRDEVMKCIQVGLLCVQDQASNRPTMIEVTFMLSTENPQLPLPRKPAFFINNTAETPEEAHTQVEIFSINELTESIIEVR